MAKRRPAGPFKDFTNVDEVFERMLELGFFNSSRDFMESEKAELFKEPNPASPFYQDEHWFSNGGLEVKIFRRMFGAFELCNYKRIISKELDGLFEIAEVPKIKG